MTGRSRDAFDETMAVFDTTATPCAPLTASEVAEQLDCTRRTAYDRLQQLAERGDLRTKKIGARGRVWWCEPTADRPTAAGAERDHSPTDRCQRPDAPPSAEAAQFEAMVDAVEEYAVFALDPDGHVAAWNDGARRLGGYDRDAILGEHVSTFYTEADVAASVPEENLVTAAASGTATDEGRRVRADGSRFRARETLTAVRDDDGDLEGYVVVTRDTTGHREQAELERQLRRYERIVETVDDGVYAVDDDANFAMVNGAFCEMVGREREELIGRPVTTVYDDDVAPLVEEKAAAVSAGEQDVATLECDLETGDGEPVPVESRFGPSPDGEGGRCGVVRDATERRARERDLERQREQLAALNNLNTVLRDVTDVVIDQSTREEIERTVCEALASSDTYEFAWIGDVDGTSREIRLRAEAGVSGYLDDVTVSIDPDDSRSHGPTGRAARTESLQVSQDVHRDPGYEPWLDHAERYGYRSSAAIPIVHEDTLYGVLNVYAKRSRAFDGEERRMIGLLGEIVGHAIGAVERKRALMSDEIVEVQFRIEDVFGTVGAPVETEGTVSLDQTVPVAADEFLVYGTATADATDALPSLVESVPHWEEVTFRTEGDPAEFELLLTDPPVLSLVASLGGYVDSACIDGGDYRMTVHLSPSVDVRRLIDDVQESYPAAQMVSRRQISRSPDGPERALHLVEDDLTDRQRAAIESAYHSGFFEWPRESSGEDVASSLDVSPPTFHQHLRKAERKIFDSLL